MNTVINPEELARLNAQNAKKIEQEPIFTWTNAYTDEKKQVFDIESFDIDILRQNQHKYGIRTVSDGILYHDKKIDDVPAIPYFNSINGSICGYCLIGRKGVLKVGMPTEYLGVNLHQVRECLIATDDPKTLQLLSDTLFSVVFNDDINTAIYIINDCDDGLKRIAISSSEIDEVFQDWRMTPSDDLNTLKNAIYAKLKDIQPEPPKPNKLHIVCMNDIKAEPIHWLWRDWLPLGKLTLLAGVGGCGKTNLALSLASVISQGGDFPDGTPCTLQGSILIFSTEDDPSDVIKPRLMANKANMAKVYMLQGTIDENGKQQPFNPERDLPSLLEYAQTLSDLRLIIIDPIVSFVKGDSNDNDKVRKALDPLVDFAMKSRCAIIGITHFSKNSASSKTAHRVLGGQAFSAVCRMLWVASKKDGENEGILAIAKTNITTDDRGMTYCIEPVALSQDISSTRINWLEVVHGNANELMGEYDNPKQFDSVLDEAKEILRTLLTDHDKLSYNDVFNHVKQQGISKSTLERAKKELDIKSQKLYENGKATWYWILPTEHRLDEPPTPI